MWLNCCVTNNQCHGPGQRHSLHILASVVAKIYYHSSTFGHHLKFVKAVALIAAPLIDT